MSDDRTELLAACDEACAAAEADAARLVAATPGSGWTAAQHLAHIALANGRIHRALVALVGGRGTPRPGPAPEPAGAILAAGAIPRGVADAPPGTEPAEVVDLAGTRRSLAATREAFAALAWPVEAGNLAAPHPALGPLTAPEWVRFAVVHTRHHVAIVRELLAST